MSVKTNLGRVGLVPRGEYDSESSYRRLDFVVFEGSSYVALKDTQGVEPKDGEVWLLFAAKGDTGNVGAPGTDGKTPVITVTVETGEPGTQAQVRQGGTAEAPTLHFIIPKGEQGPSGRTEGVPYSDDLPAAPGEASPGTSDDVARGDHVHPTTINGKMADEKGNFDVKAADVHALADDSICMVHLTIPREAWKQDVDEEGGYTVRAKHDSFTACTCIIQWDVSASTERNQVADIIPSFSVGSMQLSTAELPIGELDMTMVLAERAEDVIELEVSEDE